MDGWHGEASGSMAAGERPPQSQMPRVHFLENLRDDFG
jgi:hypothetical protein